MTNFEKLIDEFTPTYLGDYDEENHNMTLYNVPMKKYKDIYIRIRQLCGSCKITTISVTQFNSNIKISDIDL